MITDIEFDCETLGLSPAAAVTEIGAVGYNLLNKEFDEKSSLLTEANITTIDSTKFEVDLGTLAWRIRQGHADALLAPHRIPHRLALEIFAEWVRTELVPDGRVWSRGMYDVLWVEHAFKVYGIKTPWKYYQIRDSRTFTDRRLHNVGVWAEAPNPMKHTALADARSQAHDVHSAYWCRP
jgi:hypothetical protein